MPATPKAPNAPPVEISLDDDDDERTQIEKRPGPPRESAGRRQTTSARPLVEPAMTPLASSALLAASRA